MKKNLVLITFSILLGIAFTFFVLNKKDTYAKEEYLVYAFQVGAFEKKENADNYANYLPTSIVYKEDNLYKVFVAIYKNIDIINKMVVYFENNDINVYLKSLDVDKEFYKTLENYEEFINKASDTTIFNKINQSILNSFKESIQ